MKMIMKNGSLKPDINRPRHKYRHIYAKFNSLKS